MISKNRIDIVLPIIIIFICVKSISGIETPDEPHIPEVFLNNKADKAFSFPATIRFASNKIIKTVIVLPVDRITFSFAKNGRIYKKTEIISNIIAFEFLKWHGRKTGKDSYQFYPIRIKIILGDKSAYQCNHNIKELNRLIIKNSSGEPRRNYHGKFYAYSIYYDSWKDNRWVNSQSTDYSYPETHPHKDAVVEIKLKKKFNKDDEYMIIKKLLQIN